MGGMGSGRYGGAPTSEATNSFVVNAKMLRGLQAGTYGTAPIRFYDRYEDEDFELRITVDTKSSYPGILQFAHMSRDGRRDRMEYTVYLATTPQPFGGERWWFQYAGTNVLKLYLPLGGRRFMPRSAYKLGYACQRGTAVDRAHIRLGRIAKALGERGYAGVDECPPRPKGMHHSTYERLENDWYDTTAVIDRALTGFVARHYARLRGIA